MIKERREVRKSDVILFILLNPKNKDNNILNMGNLLGKHEQ